MKWLLLAFVATAGIVAGHRVKLSYPDHFPEPVFDFKQNKLTEEKIALGRELFYDPALSNDGTISCASCHSPYNAFAHTDHSLSHGIGDSIGRRNAPALFNLAWKDYFMWDGRIDDLDKQALAPLTHPREMAMDLNRLSAKISNDNRYRALFRLAFGDDRISAERIAQALAGFELTLISANSKYDAVRQGKAAFTDQEQRGYEIYDKTCSLCHVEPLFTNNQLMNIALPENPQLNDKGMYEDTKDPEDIGYFMTPSLRNLSYTFPYMHDGRYKKLGEVIDYYKSVALKDSVDRRLTFLWQLSDNEEVDLISFLRTLNDSSFVFNKLHHYPAK